MLAPGFVVCLFERAIEFIGGRYDEMLFGDLLLDCIHLNFI